ncbi:hypothetical protein KQH82_13835 [bacterium]|nr:hypothetical protein [bacterium]
MAANFFLIGAGLTKAAIPSAPLNNDLVRLLVECNANSTVGKLAERFGEESIEILLTIMDIEIMKGNVEPQVRRSVEAELANYCRRLRFDPVMLKDRVWLHEFATETFGRSDTIVNLNYDCFLEGLLDYEGLWCPSGGYGGIVNPLVDAKLNNPLGIQVLKIHGSESFTDASLMDRPAFHSVTFEFEESIFRRSAKDCHMGRRSVLPVSPESQPDGARPCLIAPSFVKLPNFELGFLMLKAIKEINESNTFVVIGCSLRDEDAFLWLLLSRFVCDFYSERRKLVILSPDAASISDRVRCYFSNDLAERIVEIPEPLEQGYKTLQKVLS